MLKAAIKQFIKRACYRLWQFKKALAPKYSQKAWQKACSSLKPKINKQLNKLGRAEKAHIMRVYNRISKQNALSEGEKQKLKELALVHDIGKTLTKQGLLLKAIRVLFNLPKNEHCIKGARLLKQCGCDKKLVIRVLRHHSTNGADELLKKFMLIDDWC